MGPAWKAPQQQRGASDGLPGSGGIVLVQQSSPLAPHGFMHLPHLEKGLWEFGIPSKSVCSCQSCLAHRPRHALEVPAAVLAAGRGPRLVSVGVELMGPEMSWFESFL